MATAAISHSDTIATLQAQLTNVESINGTAKSTVVITEAKLQEALQQLESTQSTKKTSDASASANSWWLHIANDIKTKQNKDRNLHVAPPTDSSPQLIEDHKQQQNEALISQGKEITLLRQQLLQQQIGSRRRKEEDSERLRASLSRIAALEQAIRIRRDDGTTRLRELETALRVVSGRSDLHASLANTRQELASERVASVHQKGELELYVKLLEDEKQRGSESRSKTQAVQDELDNLRVVATLEGIEGIDPLAIIEKFATTAVAQEREIGRLKQVQNTPNSNSNPNNTNNNNTNNTNNSNNNNNNNNNNPDGSLPRTDVDINLDKLKMNRLVSRIHQMETELEQYQQKTLETKSQSLEHSRNSDNALRDTTLKYNRLNAKLARKLISANSECEELRVKIELFQNKDIENDELLRLANADLERTKQKLQMQSQLAQKAATFKEEKMPAIHSEVARLQSLLDERTSQVSVLLQSIESLQSAAAVFNTTEGGSGGGGGGGTGSSESSTTDETKSPTGMEMDDQSISISINDEDDSIFDNNNRASSNGNSNGGSSSWAIQNVSKRVVSLTAELSSAIAVASMMERRAERLTLEVEQVRNPVAQYNSLRNTPNACN